MGLQATLTTRARLWASAMEMCSIAIISRNRQPLGIMMILNRRLWDPLVFRLQLDAASHARLRCLVLAPPPGAMLLIGTRGEQPWYTLLPGTRGKDMRGDVDGSTPISDFAVSRSFA